MPSIALHRTRDSSHEQAKPGERLKEAGNPVKMLRNSKIGAYVYPIVPYEFTNWRDEQRAWRETAVLFDQSHHMAELTVKGPDALKLISYTTINSFANFTPNKAKQMVPCSYDGYVIGDGILFYLDENELLFVGTRADRQLAAVPRRDRRIQGRDHPRRPLAVDAAAARPSCGGTTATRSRDPNATQVLERLNGGPMPDVKFFNMDAINIKGRKVRALAAWHGRRAGSRDLGPVRRARGDPRGDHRGGQGSRPGRRSALAPTRATRSSRAGFPRRCPRFTPARR